MKGWGSIPLRIGVGMLFVAHGLQKTFGLFGGAGIEGFSKFLSGLGFAPSIFWAYVAGYTELLGGLCILAGAYTKIASSLLCILMVVATLKVHLAKGFFMGQGGFEYNFLILCSLVSLFITGPGKYSIIKK